MRTRNPLFIDTHIDIHGSAPALAVSLLLGLILCLPGIAGAAVTVTGTGEPSMDLKNVQKAMDAGGEIVLKGRFDFGSDGSIKIRQQTRISGVLGSDGRPDTTIMGGRWSLHSPLPVPGAPPSNPGPIVSLKNLRFTGARGTPLHFEYVGALTVRNIVVEKVRPETIRLKGFQNGSAKFAAGIVVGTRLAQRRKPIKDAVTGKIRITDSRFYMDVDHPSRTLGRGIMCVWTHAAAIRIAGNVVRNATRNGIEAFDNYTGPDGVLEIEGNNIITDREGIEYPNPLTPNGIAAGWFLDTATGASPSAGAPPVVSRNRIEVRGDRSIGLALFANNAVAVCNDLILAGGEDAMGIAQTGSFGFFMNNRIRGMGRYAVYTAPFENFRAAGNTFGWTQASGFDALRGNFYFGSDGNSVLGKSGPVVDKGRGNRFLDIKPCSLPGIDPGEDWEPVEDLP